MPNHMALFFHKNHHLILFKFNSLPPILYYPLLIQDSYGKWTGGPVPNDSPMKPSIFRKCHIS